MATKGKTLKDMKVYKDIHSILSPFFPDQFILIVYEHMRNNEEDEFNHEYLRDSLFVMRKLIDNADNLEPGDPKLLYCIMALIESGRPLTTERPYELSPGISWIFLRLYAPDSFGRDDLAFISKSCKPLMPQTLRPSHRVQLRLLVHNTKHLTNVVNFKYKQLYNNFIGGAHRQEPIESTDKQFLDYYGPKGNLWPAISDSAKRIFSTEVAKFKREVEAEIKRNR